MRYQVRATCALIVLCAQSVSAQQPPTPPRSGAGIAALIDAENAKSALCKGYVGTTASPRPFDILAQSLAGAGPKGEFETTAQYQARVKARAMPSGPVLITVPIDRDYLRYDADRSVMIVEAGTFVSGALSGDGMAEAALQMLLSTRGVATEFGMARVSIKVGSVNRQTGTETGRNFLGTPVRILQVERHTRGLSLDGSRPGEKGMLHGGGLFSFAQDEDAPVMGFEMAAAQAARLKPTLKAVLAVEPVPPRVVAEATPGYSPTARNPIRYTERATIIVGTPRCALIVDGQMRVLASADAGPKR